MTQTVNLQVATFAGLGLPRTLNKPVPSSTSTRDVLAVIYDLLPSPDLGPRLIVSTISGRRLSPNSDAPISTYLSANDSFLPLRLSTRLCGGKGGFGSQLRAAGGRMSSRKKRDQQNATGSNRNLDGRRLRTIDEAKRLAEYLDIKPEMERKEKEERRKRWEAVVQAAEETEEKIKAGRMGSNQGRLDAEYVESKELAEDKVRDAVARAMREGMLQSGRSGSETSVEANVERSDSDEGTASSSSTGEGGSRVAERVGVGRTFFGWDDDEEEDDEDEDDRDDAEDDEGERDGRFDDNLTTEPSDAQPSASEGKGKEKAA